MTQWPEIDRSTWPPGPWDSEPDSFRGKAHGLDFCCFRNYRGAWCGYVGVDSSHPLYEHEWHWEITFTVDQVLSGEAARRAPIIKKLEDIKVHGGITFSDFCPKRGEGLWWFGFDCSNLGDLVPNPRGGRASNEVYRDLEYVKAECIKLALQFHQLT